MTNTDRCPYCLAPSDEFTTVDIESAYDKDGHWWQRGIIRRPCGHEQVIDYPMGVIEHTSAVSGTKRPEYCPQCGTVLPEGLRGAQPYTYPGDLEDEPDVEGWDCYCAACHWGGNIEPARRDGRP